MPHRKPTSLAPVRGLHTEGDTVSWYGIVCGRFLARSMNLSINVLNLLILGCFMMGIGASCTVDIVDGTNIGLG